MPYAVVLTSQQSVQILSRRLSTSLVSAKNQFSKEAPKIEIKVRTSGMFVRKSESLLHCNQDLPRRQEGMTLVKDMTDKIIAPLSSMAFGTEI